MNAILDWLARVWAWIVYVEPPAEPAKPFSIEQLEKDIDALEAQERARGAENEAKRAAVVRRLEAQRVIAQRLIDEVVSRVPGAAATISQSSPSPVFGALTELVVKDSRGYSNCFTILEDDSQEAVSARMAFAHWVAMERTRCHE